MIKERREHKQYNDILMIYVGYEDNDNSGKNAKFAKAGCIMNTVFSLWSLKFDKSS